MSALRILALSYLASASVFVVTATLVAHPGLTRTIAGGAQGVAAMVENVWQPPARDEENSAVVRLILAPPAEEGPAAQIAIVPQPRTVQPPELADSEPSSTITILPDLTPEPPAPSQAPTRGIARNDAAPAAPAFHIPEPPAWSEGASRSDDKQWSGGVSRSDDKQRSAGASRSDEKQRSGNASRSDDKHRSGGASRSEEKHRSASTSRSDDEQRSEGASRSDNKMTPEAPVTDRATAVSMRLRAGLTPEMLRHFDLFLYVSKADRGPLAQRLYVFRKNADGDLKLAYDWAASTGREQDEISPTGHRSFTATPRGYYELDPRRMYRTYRSVSWDQDMPNAMFFNWEREGLQTGLAIHAASGKDVFKLGSRASAGCVHLAPENAATLFELIHGHYRGPVPRFAYNYETQTMSNTGVFMRNSRGHLKMADGYRVLVLIEDYGGENVVAALF